MSAILHRGLHGHSSHLSSTSQPHQFRIHRLIKETMASFHDQLQCCLLVPKTNENENKTPTTHTRSKTKTDEALSESTQNQRPTVSANPHPPMEDRCVRQVKTVVSLKILRVQNSTFVVSLSLERDYIVVPRKLSLQTSYILYVLSFGTRQIPNASKVQAR